MEPLAILVPIILSFLILVMPSRVRYLYTLAVTILIIIISSYPSLSVFLHPGQKAVTYILSGVGGDVTLTFDSLSAFFILVTNFTMFTGLLYSNGYLKPYRELKSPASFALHYFCYAWLHLSMIGVLALRDGLAFLISWELMAVSSFMLILFEAEIRTTLKTAVNYLIQMHVGLVLLIIAFLVVEKQTGVFGFDGLHTWFDQQNNLPLFLLFFAGFAIKAGFIPFHTWLPSAHPAAPSHVSGIMSGVMIKMGIYGIVRVLIDVQQDQYTIGTILLGISLITCFYGILSSVVQNDLKKLLAYSTIENVGIIGTGIGLGTIGLGSGNATLAILGFGGGLFHVLNHSLFKSLLFFGAGSVYSATHTRNIEQLGGLIHRMPRTAGLFLFGSVAICALPPLNGFISELMIYYGLFSGLQSGSVYQSMVMMIAIITIAITGGIAIFGFSKAFGVTFLGASRTDVHINENAISAGMLFPKLLIAAVILLAGLAPLLFLSPIMGMTSTLFHLDQVPEMNALFQTLAKISLVSIILITLIILLLLIRRRVNNSSKTTYGPTWGCGYTNPSPRQQYTGTSWAANIAELAGPILREKVECQPIYEEEVFPADRSISGRFGDVFRSAVNYIADFSALILKKIARLQTGNIQHYILYAFIFILVIFILLYLNIL